MHADGIERCRALSVCPNAVCYADCVSRPSFSGLRHADSYGEPQLSSDTLANYWTSPVLQAVLALHHQNLCHQWEGKTGVTSFQFLLALPPQSRVR